METPGDLQHTHLLFQILLNKSSDSLSLFCVGSSRNTILKLEHAVTKMIAVTSLKHCIHLRRSSRWPPTSNILANQKLIISQSSLSIIFFFFRETY